MKTNALILLFLLLAAGFSGKAQAASRDTESSQKVNIGIKVGFNSSMFFIDRFSLGNTELKNLQNNYKVGYLGAFFCRFNMKKHHFFQTEFSYNISKGSISMPNTAENIPLLQENALVKTDIHSIDVPLLYGYKFIDKYPYGMAFFIGPKAAYIWDKHSDSEYSGFYQQYINEEMRPFSFSGVVGLSVNVSNIFFDFRYEVGLHNMVKSVSYNKDLTDAPYNTQDISLKRRHNVLSFSVGVIF